ncbi:MAG: hypothetical protein LBN93_05330 [Candidatus Symbiothrix sp.]|jgi:uncharacterized protein (TIGR02145 family)|nr:hypothetical protein [Candidatus Symbiothrix sp.]
MKKIILLVFVCICGQIIANAQVKIGGDIEIGVTTGAVLELDGSMGGLMLPQVVDTTDVTLRKEGMLVYSKADKKTYTYNGSAWQSAGLTPTPTPGDCGKLFTAPSGQVYNTAVYANGGLTNLCWITTNLRESGQAYMCYNNDCTNYPTRGYYYTWSRAIRVCSEMNTTDNGMNWRCPTRNDYDLLVANWNSLIRMGDEPSTDAHDAALEDWKAENQLAGIMSNAGSGLGYFNQINDLFDSSVGYTGTHYMFNRKTGSSSLYTLPYINNFDDYRLTARCVRNI